MIVLMILRVKGFMMMIVMTTIGNSAMATQNQVNRHAFTGVIVLQQVYRTKWIGPKSNMMIL